MRAEHWCTVADAVLGGGGSILVALLVHARLATAPAALDIGGVVLVGTLWYVLVDLALDITDWAIGRRRRRRVAAQGV